MTKAQWAKAALLAIALPACAHANGAGSVSPTQSLSAGQAAQPGSWIPHASREPAGDQLQVASSLGSGQAAQPYSWFDMQSPVAPKGPTPLAHEGPSYLGGRAGQPAGYIQPKERIEVRQLALR